MLFGAAKETITPYKRMNMQGFAAYFGNDLRAVHDDIYVRALVMEDDDSNRMLILSFDLLFHEYQLASCLAGFAYESLGIPAGSVLINYTHNHCGPALKRYNQWEFSEEYEAYIEEAAKRCMMRAVMGMTPGTALYAETEGDWNISRRLMKDGECLFRPNPEGKRNKKLNIIKFIAVDGHVKAMLFNYACHPSSLKSDYAVSGEYPGRLCQLADTYFYGNTSVFIQGFSADIKSRYTVSGDGESFMSVGFDIIDTMASEMWGTVKEAVYKKIDLKLTGRHFKTKLDLNIYPKAYYIEQRKLLLEGKSFFLAACAEHVIENYEKLGASLDLNSAMMRLSDKLYIFALGGEPPCGLETVLQKAFPDLKLIFAGYMDDIAYIPSDSMIREGGYEAEGSVIEYRLKGSIVPGVDARIVEAFRENFI